MKKFLVLFLTLIVLFTSALSVSAHSGRTDGAGGHYDSAEGSYHYHHGYPAHSHTNGECPYDYRNNEDTEPDYEIKEDKPEKGKWEPSKGTVFVLIIFGILIVSCIGVSIWDKVKKR